MPQQLNVRSDKAFFTAKRLSRTLGVSTTKVVEDALAEMEKRTIAPSDKVTPKQAQEFFDSVMAMVKEANAGGKLALDDRELYDERGLPK